MILLGGADPQFVTWAPEAWGLVFFFASSLLMSQPSVIHRAAWARADHPPASWCCFSSFSWCREQQAGCGHEPWWEAPPVGGDLGPWLAPDCTCHNRTHSAHSSSEGGPQSSQRPAGRELESVAFAGALGCAKQHPLFLSLPFFFFSRFIFGLGYYLEDGAFPSVLPPREWSALPLCIRTHRATAS